MRRAVLFVVITIAAIAFAKSETLYYGPAIMQSDTTLMLIAGSNNPMTVECRAKTVGKRSAWGLQIGIWQHKALSLWLIYDFDRHSSHYNNRDALLQLKLDGQAIDSVWVALPDISSKQFVSLVADVDPSYGRVEVSAGRRKPVKIHTFQLEEPIKSTAAVVTEGTVELLHLIADFDPRLDREMPEIEVSDSVCGQWHYLDRITESTNVRLGGEYDLAITPSANGSGWDIFYLGGAQTDAPRWQSGVLKGRLTPTGFTSHWDLQWISANGLPLITEAYATLSDDGRILTLDFPTLEARLRFSKVK